MQCLVTLLVMVGLAPTDPGGPKSTAPLRTRADWVHQVGDTLRRQATADDVDQPQVMVEMISLYHQLSADTRLGSSDRRRLQHKLRRRLLRLSDELSRDVEERVARIQRAQMKRAQMKRARVKGIGRTATAGGQPDRMAAGLGEDQRVLEGWRTVLAQVGQAGGAAGRGGAAGGLPDDGERLVELIQTVISPDSWDVNGGPMTVVYYRNGRVLVVSATSEVHEQVGGLAEALRRAGN
ncbi:MAG: hypothetical protein GTO04_17255 [Planctomycetales bacterium]|nr:hypothetical protein [Planctomycetales bacterium]